MANWDNLTIECENEELIKKLIEGKTGIDGLWFREATMAESEPTKAYLSVRNGIDWLTAFKVLSCTYNAEVKTYVTFEHDGYHIDYHLIVKNDSFEIVKVKANYLWRYKDYEPTYKPAFNANGEPLEKDGKTLYEIIENELSDEEMDFIESYFRKIDNFDEQENLFVATQGESGDIKYLSDYGITKEFTFNDKVASIRKQGSWINIDNIKPISNQADQTDCPF
jgi:hypothetical protein